MFSERILLVLGCILHIQTASGVFWTCSSNSDCASLPDSICEGGRCVCPPGKQSVMGGTVCGDVAPYHVSECIEDFQCSGLFTTFECRRANSSDQVGNCFCQSGNHYFRGRCWGSIPHGNSCSRDEECQAHLNDPFSMVCSSGTCECAQGYYLRQRGECRRIGAAIGDGCVVDEDCQFEGGACSATEFTCFNANAAPASKTLEAKEAPKALDLQSQSTTGARIAQAYGTVCNANVACPAPLSCSVFGVCLCPTGYYSNPTNTLCLAELGSPVTSPDQCVGFFTEVRDGVCVCQANFQFNENMRSCVKMARTIRDSCMSDANCQTFGVHARCGPPQQWGVRSCECNLEHTVWDSDRQLCRLFAGIGEPCNADSECLAGDMEIQCVQADNGQGYCACPEGYLTHEGLCLTLGLNLGDTCQISLECTGTDNMECNNGVCSCTSGYQPVDGSCAPALGGSCEADADCLIENTICSQATGTCQCQQEFVEFQELCWPRISGYGAACNVTQQCVDTMGDAGACVGGLCECADSYHYRDGRCWQRTGLFETCSRTSECFLSGVSERVHCRNSLCQCTFDYPYSEELGTCRSSAATIFGNTLVMVTALFYLFSS